MKKILPVYPWPMHAKIADALAAMPNVNPVKAMPGGPGPVLAIRKAPPFMCDAIVVDAPERLAEGVNVALSNGIRMVTVRDMVGEIFGGDIPETVEKVKSKVVFK